MLKVAAEAYHYNNLMTALQQIINERCKHDCAYQFWFLLFPLLFLSSAETSSLTVFLLPSCLAALFFCSQALAHTPDYALCLILAPQTTQNLRDRSGISRRVCRAVRYRLQDIKSTECYQSDLHLPCQLFFHYFCQQTSIYSTKTCTFA